MKCRICGCSQYDACPGGCGWAPAAGNLCTVCAKAVHALLDWVEGCRKANWSALKRELNSPTAGGVR